MLTSGHFWLGVGTGVALVYAFHMYSAKKAAGN